MNKQPSLYLSSRKSILIYQHLLGSLPSFAVYRIYTSILFHGSLLHVLFNMMAFVPLGSELERIMGSVRLLFLIMLLATSNAIFHLFIALLVAYNPFKPSEYFMNECGIGFSGILFSMIVIETSLSGVQSRRCAIHIATLMKHGLVEQVFSSSHFLQSVFHTEVT